jgi:hypothetical protein
MMIRWVQGNACESGKPYGTKDTASLLVYKMHTTCGNPQAFLQRVLQHVCLMQPHPNANSAGLGSSRRRIATQQPASLLLQRVRCGADAKMVWLTRIDYYYY